jgi:hypothetical protein
MKLIPLTQNQFAQVDDWNYDWLSQWKWYALKGKQDTYYAARNIITNNKSTLVLMHRIIMNTPPNKQCDHYDHNGLNCLEENLRNCTHAQNNYNRRPSGKSPYLGVSFIYHTGNKTTITAQIKYKNIRYYLGSFITEELAALAYDAKAKELFGEFANLNFPDV